jgi:hypothetical protein
MFENRTVQAFRKDLVLARQGNNSGIPAHQPGWVGLESPNLEALATKNLCLWRGLYTDLRSGKRGS